MTAHIPFSGEDQARLLSMFGPQAAGLHVNTRGVLPFSAARGPAWHDLRRNTIGASEISAVVGVKTAPVSAFTLWWRKRLGWEIEPEERMTIGLRLEHVIGELFAEKRTDVFLARPAAALYVHPTFDHVTCSPDFLGVIEVGGQLWIVPVECKSDEGGEWGSMGSGDVPEHHRLQALWQATVFDAPFAFVAHMAQKRFRWYVVPNDLGDREEANGLIVAARDFLHSVRHGEPPDPDDHTSTEETLKTLYSTVDEETTSTVDDGLATEFIVAAAERRDALKRYRRAVNRLRHAMGTAHEAASPTYGRFAQRQRYSRRPYDVKESTVDRIMPLPRKDEE